jgi:glutathione synthase/RimK-type ligase-like ATP-grasp enzyme
MKTVVFLGSKQFGDKNDASRLAALSAEQLGGDYEVRHYFFEDLVFYISDKSRSVWLADGNTFQDVDLVIALNWYKTELRDIAYTLGLYLEEQKIECWNGEILQQRSTSKLSAMWLLAQANVPIPETYFSMSREALVGSCDAEAAIIKDIAASRGRSNFLAKDRAEFEGILRTPNDARYMVQEYIPNDFDIRLVCFGGIPTMAIKRQRTNNDTHLNNTSQGGEATVLELGSLPAEVLNQAESICKLFKREMAGIDYLVANDATNRYICLEVNAIPQLTSGSYQLEKQQQLTQAIQQALRKDRI